MPHSRYKKERTTTFSPFCSFIVFDLLWEVSPRPPQSALRASEPFSHPFLSAREWGKPPIQPPVAMRHPPFRGNAGTCCASLAEPGCLPVVASLLPPGTAADAAFASLHFYPPFTPEGTGEGVCFVTPFQPGHLHRVPRPIFRDEGRSLLRFSHLSSQFQGRGERLDTSFRIRRGLGGRGVVSAQMAGQTGYEGEGDWL